MNQRALSLALMASLALVANFAAATEAPASSYQKLATLFSDWRAFNHPAIVGGRPDYSAAAMAKKAEGLAAFRARLKAIDPSGWSTVQKNDHRLVEAEMKGLDFFLRILKPWERDPVFYATVFPEMSDVPAHEGPSAEPNIDLFAYKFPLSPADDARLTELLGAIPALLADARVNLAGSTAHDLWAYGDQAFADQADFLAQWQKGASATARPRRHPENLARRSEPGAQGGGREISRRQRRLRRLCEGRGAETPRALWCRQSRL